MRLLPKTAEDFGITFTGSELESFDQRFADSFENDKNNTSKGQVKFWFIEIICLAINLLIAFDQDKQFVHPVITAITAVLPILAACVFIYSFFVKNNALKMRLRLLSAFSQFFLIISVSFAAIGSQTLFDFLLTIANLIIGFIAGMISWRKFTMKNFSDCPAEKSNSKALSIIGPIISAAMVPVIRFLTGLMGKDLKYSVGKVLLVFISGLLGWLFGMLTQGIRYYAFIKKHEVLDAKDE